jgi:hypothetical protein
MGESPPSTSNPRFGLSWNLLRGQAVLQIPQLTNDSLLIANNIPVFKEYPSSRSEKI